MYNSNDNVIVSNAIDTIHSIVKRTDAQCIEELILPFKRAANTMFKSEASKNTFVSGLTNPEGWQPILIVLRDGLLNSLPETKEIAAIAMGQLISLSNEAGIF